VMSPFDLFPWMPDWGYALAGWLLLAASLLLLSVWGWGDRPRGRRRCRRCWYELGPRPGDTPPGDTPPGDTPPGGQCPECGTTHRSEAQLARVRRRWHTGVASMLALLVGLLALAQPTVRTTGWMGTLPDALLVAWVRLTDDQPPSPSRLTRELLRRWQKAPGEVWQAQWLAEHLIRPRVGYRPVWPRSVPFALVTDLSGQVAPHTRLLYNPLKMPDPTPARAPNSNDPRSIFTDFDQPDEVPYVDPSRSYETFWIEPARLLENLYDGFSLQVFAAPNRQGGERPVADVWFNVRLVDRLDQAIRPVQSPVADQAVRAALRPRLVRMISGRPALTIDEPPDLFTEGDTRYTVAVRVEAIRDGVAVLRGRWRMIDPIHPTSRKPLPEPVRLLEIPAVGTQHLADFAGLTATHPDLPRWSLRITGDGEYALRDFRAQAYWAGQITVPAANLFPQPAD